MIVSLCLEREKNPLRVDSCHLWSLAWAWGEIWTALGVSHEAASGKQSAAAVNINNSLLIDTEVLLKLA